jgi:hypothetical protein
MSDGTVCWEVKTGGELGDGSTTRRSCTDPVVGR